jgi:hypothetical protein
MHLNVAKANDNNLINSLIIDQRIVTKMGQT